MVYSKAKCEGKRKASLKSEIVWRIERNNAVIDEIRAVDVAYDVTALK